MQSCHCSELSRLILISPLRWPVDWDARGGGRFLRQDKHSHDLQIFIRVGCYGSFPFGDSIVGSGLVTIVFFIIILPTTAKCLNCASDYTLSHRILFWVDIVTISKTYFLESTFVLEPRNSYMKDNNLQDDIISS